MPPGRKRQPVAEEASMTDYERVRLQNMMRNNQRLQALGVGALTSLLNNSSKTKNMARQPQHDLDQEVLGDQISEENSPDNNLTMNTMQIRGTRSKRVMAIEEEDQSARMTRQRTKELLTSEQVPEGSTNAQENMLAAADGLTQPDDQIQLCNEGEQNALGDRWIRGKSMGKDLDRITRGLCSKIPVHIAEGNKRPEAPMQAAKLASEGGIILRNHIPVLPHWKEYKKNKDYLENYIGKISGQFSIDINNKAVIAACTDLMKSGQRQLRYKLKKAFFDGVLANEVPTKSPSSTITDEQWKALVEMWSSAKHKDKCLANKRNREKVQYHQGTGSRCFIAHAHILKQQEQYKDAPPTAIDLFKDCHCSRKTGITEAVKDAIAQMKAILAEPVEEGQAPKTPAEAIVQVMPSTKFLQNVSLDPAGTKRGTKVVAAARVRELEAKVEAEKQVTTVLKDKLEDLDNKVADSEEAREKQLGEIEELKKQIEELKKQQEETNTVLRFFASINKE